MTAGSKCRPATFVRDGRVLVDRRELADPREFASTVLLFIPPGLVPAAWTMPVTRAVAGFMAGYSGTPLVRKLGVKERFRVTFPGAPDDFPATLGALPEGVEVTASRAGPP